MASNAENYSIWWRHHDYCCCSNIMVGSLPIFFRISSLALDNRMNINNQYGQYWWKRNCNKKRTWASFLWHDVPSGNKPLHKPMLPMSFVAIWRHCESISVQSRHTTRLCDVNFNVNIEIHDYRYMIIDTLRQEQNGQHAADAIFNAFPLKKMYIDEHVNKICL